LTGPGAYKEWWLFPSTGKIEIITKNSSTHIFGRNKLTLSAYEEWWLFHFFALVGHRENKLKKRTRFLNYLAITLNGYWASMI